MSTLNQISVGIIESENEMRAALRIRQTVFVEEQNVPPEIEYDEFETVATHILASINDKVVGTARWRKTESGYKLERFAVLAEFRGQGVGDSMVSFILTQIHPEAFIYLNSQVSAISFYARLGFKAVGEIFYEADIPHRKMVYRSSS